MIEAPYTWAKIHKNPISANGRVLASDVVGYARGKKRKRPELAVAVDCETVNLYDVTFPTQNKITKLLILSSDPIIKTNHVICRFSSG